MKIIEALKKVKNNREKISDLQQLIQQNCAHMESQKGSTPYNDPKKKIKEWVQSIHDTQKENSKLLSQIQKTNLETLVTIEMPSGTQVEKSISEWIVRRREGVDTEIETYNAMSSRLQQQAFKKEDGTIEVDNVVLNYSSEDRDKKTMDLGQEKSLIDAKLEIVNATTDLLS